MTAPTQPAVGTQGAAGWADNLVQWLGGAGQFWTPVLLASTTNPTLGTGGSTAGKFVQVGKLVVGGGLITFGTSGTSAGSGTFVLQLPTGVDAYAGVGQLVGHATLRSAGTYTRADLYLTAANPGQCRFVYTSAAVSGSYISATNALPGAWTANDSIQFLLSYLAV